MNDQELATREETELKKQVKAMEEQFATALAGSAVKSERFVRAVMTAVAQDPDLLIADRRSFFNAAMQCAHDGLVPDKREAAFVVFNTKEKKGGKEYWIKKVQHMPMYQGIMKKVRGSGELSSWKARAVFAKDHFDFELGDNEYIVHKPCLHEEDPGPVIAAYSIAKLSDGEVLRDVLPRRKIERARQSSKVKDSGPWVTDYDEMAIKTVIRHHGKQLPLSPEAMEIITRDDGMTTLDEDGPMRDITPPPRPKRGEPANTSEEPVNDPPESEHEPPAEDQADDDSFPGDKPWPKEADEKQRAKPKPSQKAAKPAEKQAPQAEEKPQVEDDPNAKWRIKAPSTDYLAVFKAMLRHTTVGEDVDAMLGVNSEGIAKLAQDTQDLIFKAADERKAALEPQS